MGRDDGCFGWKQVRAMIYSSLVGVLLMATGCIYDIGEKKNTIPKELNGQVAPALPPPSATLRASGQSNETENFIGNIENISPPSEAEDSVTFRQSKSPNGTGKGPELIDDIQFPGENPTDSVTLNVSKRMDISE